MPASALLHPARHARTRRLAVALATAAAIVLALVVWAAPPADAATAAAKQPSASTLSSVRAQILTDANAARVKAGLPRLKLDASLNTIAQRCALDQAKKAKMAHCVNSPTKFERTYPKGWKAGGENVGAGFTPKSVTTAWMNSAAHRRNILYTSFTSVGIGVAYDAKGRPYYTQNFASYATR